MSRREHVNFVSGRPYTGANHDTLEQAFQLSAFRKREWATFLQFRSAGRMVTKGSTGVVLNGRRIGHLFRVFNVAQTQPTTPPAAPARIAKTSTPRLPAPGARVDEQGNLRLVHRS